MFITTPQDGLKFDDHASVRGRQRRRAGAVHALRGNDRRTGADGSRASVEDEKSLKTWFIFELRAQPIHLAPECFRLGELREIFLAPLDFLRIGLQFPRRDIAKYVAGHLPE